MATIAEERDFFNAFYGGEQCVVKEPEFQTKEEALESYDEAIYLYGLMLNSAIKRNDKTDIAICKRELQEAKCAKRRLLAV